MTVYRFDETRNEYFSRDILDKFPHLKEVFKILDKRDDIEVVEIEDTKEMTKLTLVFFWDSFDIFFKKDNSGKLIIKDEDLEFLKWKANPVTARKMYVIEQITRLERQLKEYRDELKELEELEIEYELELEAEKQEQKEDDEALEW